MSQSKGTLRSIVGLPASTIGAVLNAESDWIRYGLPAFLLTVIFFLAMRYEAPPEPAPAGIEKPARGVKSSVHSPFNPANQPAIPNLTLTVPRAESAGGPAQQAVVPSQPRVQGTTPQQLEARRALCNATRLAANTPAIRRKATVLRYAVSAFKGGGGFQTAARAVNEAVIDYTAGKWNEDECPAAPDSVRIARGSIGAAIR